MTAKLAETISKEKKEPEWMRSQRLGALGQFNLLPMPKGVDVDLEKIIFYLESPTKKTKSWRELPEKIKKIYLAGYTGYPRLPADNRDERIIAHAQKEIAKTAIKTVPFVPWEHSPDVHKTLNSLKSLNYQLVAVEQTNTSLDYRQAPYKFPLALIFGHERLGVEDEILKACDQIVHIPMLGMGNSHNVAISAAIIASHLLDKPPLSPGLDCY